MAQRTKLFQNAGSPLIQGHSRSRRPFWQDWVITVAVTAGALVALRIVMSLGSPAASNAAMWSGVVSAAVLGLEVGAVVGAAGTWFGRGMGWARPWVAASALSLLVSVVVWAVWPSLR